MVPVPGPEFTGKWSLVVMGAGPSGCDADCRNTLIYARQTWLSLGKLAPRVQRVLLGGAGCCDTGYLQREQAGPGTPPPAAPRTTAPGGSGPEQGVLAPPTPTPFLLSPPWNLSRR